MNSYAEVLDAYDKGRYHIAPYRKVRVTNAATPTDMSYGNRVLTIDVATKGDVYASAFM